MKKNSGLFFGLPCWRMGAVLLVLCAFTPVSRADLINNLSKSDGSGTYATASRTDTGIVGEWEQVFIMPAASGTFSISSLTLELYSSSTGQGNVELYSVTGSGGSAVFTDQGSIGSVSVVSSGDWQQILVNPGSATLNGNSQEYAVGLTTTSGQISWDFTTVTGSGGGGTLGDQYNEQYDYNDNHFQMGLVVTPVPEVPMTGLVIGFGALAIALGHTLRRKTRPTVSSIG